MRESVEVHVPISPTEAFFRQLHYLAVSLRQRGGGLRDSSIIVTVGEDCEPFDIGRKLPWTRYYPIEFRWVPRTIFQQLGYYATAAERYRYDFQAPYVLLLDADLLISRDLDDLLERAAAEPAVYAVPAYRSPWENAGLLHIRSDEAWWQVVFEAARLGGPPLECEYSGYGALFNDVSMRRCPPYFNQGVVLAPAAIMNEIGRVLYAEMEAATRAVATVFRIQIALTFAILRQKLPWRPLPVRYNYIPTPGSIRTAAQTQYASVSPAEWDDVRVIHYASIRGWFERERVMASREALEHWLTLTGHDPIESYCREVFRSIHPEVEKERDNRRPFVP